MVPRKYTVLIHIFESNNHSESEQYTFHLPTAQIMTFPACSAKSALCGADATQGTRRGDYERTTIWRVCGAVGPPVARFTTVKSNDIMQ